MTPPDSRPNPDELLARVEEEARKRERGRLKVFFGAAPGVGKTYAMLEAAQRARASGADVVAGVVETHQRQETAALLRGLEVLPRRRIPYRGVTLEEFDLDAALARKPALMLMDELAHTNAPSCRHVKRWQDVMELIDAGIDVYSTVNVQHLDSLNDVVAQVTGVVVRETVPDSVLDQADDIELIDLPVDELRRRIEEGKVYIPDQARRSMQGFFRPGNLIALREMALRRTADRVDAQMRNYRRDHSIQSTWPVAERIIVSIGPSPFSAKLIRAAKRMSVRMGAEWIVVFVDKPEYAGASAELKERVYSSLRLAEQLGAETVTLTGNNVAATLLHFARSRNVCRIVMGKQPGRSRWWPRLVRRSVLDDVMDQSGDIEIIAITGEPGPPLGPGAALSSPKLDWSEVGRAGAIIAGCTGIGLALRPVLAPANLVMVYLLGLVGIAMSSSRRTAFLASFLSVAAFDFFCVPPYFDFAVSDYEYIVTFIGMLIVGLTIGSLTVRIRMHASQAVERESRTQALYRLTRALAGATRAFDVARIATAIAREVFGEKVVLFLPDEPGKISFRSRTTDDLPVPKSEEGIAQWVFDNGRRAGKGMDTLPGASAFYLPLKGSGSTLGVMAVAPESNDLAASPEQLRLLEIFASQIALAIERAQATAAARDAQLRMETEQMRNNLLSAVSHDLRTPLAAITGAASSLRTQRDQLSVETQRELVESIEQEADRLGRLVNNLLELTRLESGAVRVKREWHPLEEIVGAALTRLEGQLGKRAISIEIPADLPLVSVDDVLLEQVFLNLFENAAKYTPVGSAIGISARAERQGVEIEVTDSGPGFEPGDEKLAWGKFYRGKVGGQSGVAGAGLGLAICRAIVAAHGGTTSAENRAGGGAAIRIWLPLGGAPPKPPSGEG